MDNYTKVISEYIAKTTYDDLSEEAILSAKKSILDTLGIMFPATTLATTSDVVHDLFTELDGGGECTLIGYGEKASILTAAMINGSLTHAVDFDDSAGIDKPIVHPTASCLPAAISLAEYLGGVSGKHFITAITVANDVGIRIGSCVRGNILWDYDFFPPTTIGVFQATIAAAKILNLNAEQVQDALGLCLNRVAGIREGLFDCEFRSIRDAFGNEEGIRCALLASRGFKGCGNAIELLYKFIYHDNVDMSGLIEKLGVEYYNAKYVGYKPWPSCQGTHPYVQSCLEVMQENDINSNDVAKVAVTGCEQGSNLFFPKEEKSHPKSSITAKVSLPYVVAIAIKHQNVVLSDFDIRNLDDPEIIEFTENIDFVVDNSFVPNSAIATVTTKQGAVYSHRVDVLRGCVLNPMSIEEIVDKFKNNATMAKKPLSQTSIDTLAEEIFSLESVVDMKDITKLLNQ